MRSPEPGRLAIDAGRAAVGVIVAAVVVMAGALSLAVETVLAASPTPSPQLGDPRSGGQGPGLVGDPLVAIAAVVAIGLLSLAGTLLYVRATGGRRGAGT